MKILFGTFAIFLVLFVKIFDCSDSESGSRSESSDYEVAAPRLEDLGKVHSSDEEESVNGDRENNLNELRRVFDNINFNSRRHWKWPSFLKGKSSKKEGPPLGVVKPLMCLDGEGNEVDWWIVYKEPKGLKYLYYSSKTIDRNEFVPLNPDRYINDPNTSPVIQTIYHPSNRDDSEVWLGWNDQPADKVDAFGNNVCGIKHAHSKGFYAQNAAISGDKNEATVGAYAIFTSLPRFPMTTEEADPESYGSAKKNRLPADKQKIFDGNLSENAQHFMCVSFPRHKVALEKVSQVLEVPVQWDAPHVEFLTKYLKTIHAGIIGTNFADNFAGHFMWRRYFSLLNQPYPTARAYFADEIDANGRLLAYSKTDLPSLDINYDNIPNSHVFPLTGSSFYRGADGRIYYYTGNEITWRWEAKYSGQQGCYEGDEDSCIASFNLTTTNLQSEMKIQLFAKHGRFIMDLFDDWAALQLVQYQKWLQGHYTGQTVDRYGLLVQSWTDSKTILPRRPSKKIYDPENGNVLATVHVDNVEEFWMPAVEADEAVKVNRDHSKWAIGFALDTFNNDYAVPGDGYLDDEGLLYQQYEFKPLFFLCDLNRATTQVQLSGKPQGRGGGILAIGDVKVWRVMMSMLPRSQTSRYGNKTKEKARALQKTLQKHLTPTPLTSHTLPLKSLRPSLFKSLRLSKNESLTPTRAVSFLPFLNELSEYLKRVEFESEHLAFFALNRMFHLVAEGRVRDAARIAWSETREQVYLREQEGKEGEKHPPLFTVLPKFITLPRLNLYRQIPQSKTTKNEDQPHIVVNNVGQFTTMDSITCAFEQFERLDRQLNLKLKQKEKESSDYQQEEEEEEEEFFTELFPERRRKQERKYRSEYEEIINEQYERENGDYYSDEDVEDEEY